MPTSMTCRAAASIWARPFLSKTMFGAPSGAPNLTQQHRVADQLPAAGARRELRGKSKSALVSSTGDTRGTDYVMVEPFFSASV